MENYFIYHQQGVVKVIAESDLPIHMPEVSLTKGLFDTALLTKGITVADTKDLRILLSKMTGGGGMTDNTLYPIPESWQVKIEKGPSRKSGPFVTADIVTRAHLIPIEKPEPMKSKDMKCKIISGPVVEEEDQDQIWKDAALLIWGKNFVEAAMTSKTFRDIKSKFTITRK